MESNIKSVEDVAGPSPSGNEEAVVVSRLIMNTEEVRRHRLKVEALLAEDEEGDDDVESEATRKAALHDETTPSSPGSARARLEELLGSSDDEEDDYQVVSKSAYKDYRPPPPPQIEKVKLEMAQAANAAQNAAKAVAAASFSGASRAFQNSSRLLLRGIPNKQHSMSPARSNFSDEGLDSSPVRMQNLSAHETNVPTIPQLSDATETVPSPKSDEGQNEGAKNTKTDEPPHVEASSNQAAPEVQAESPININNDTEILDEEEDNDQEEASTVTQEERNTKSKKTLLKKRKKLVVNKSIKALVKPKQITKHIQQAEDQGEKESQSVLPTEDTQDVETMRRKLALLQKHAGINDEDLEWKLAETSTNDPYGLAVRERERCEERYDRLMWNQSKLEAIIRFTDDRRVIDALDAMATAAEHAFQQRHTKKVDHVKKNDDDTVEEEKKSQLVEDKKDDPRAALGAALAGRGGGGLMAAIAARGRGRGRGIGAAKALAVGALTVAGRRQGKQPKSIEKATEALRQAQERAINDVNKLPVQLEEFRIVEKSIDWVLEPAMTKIAIDIDTCSDFQGDEGSDDPEAPDPSAREARRLRLRNQMLDKRDKSISAASAAAKARIALALNIAREELKLNGRELLDAEDELDRWRKREREAPNRTEALIKEENEWAQREAAENAIALAIIRTFVPSGVSAESAETLRLRAAKTVAAAAAAAKKKQQEAQKDDKKGESNQDKKTIPIDEKKEAKRAMQVAAAWGGALTHELAQRIKMSRPLHWVQMHPDDIITSNFLAGAGADSFRNLGDYDIIELRAIYAVCPEKFELDANGAKAAWRRNLVERLRQLTDRDRGESVKAGWDAVNNRRKLTKLPPLEPKLKRHPTYYYPSTNELEARSKKLTEARTRLDERRKKVDDLEKNLAEAKAERDAAFADARSEYLQQRYGKPMLKQLARDADDAYKRLLTELGNDVVGAKADLKRAASAVANASPTEAEHASLRKLLEKYKLDIPDPQADATDCRRLARKALDKLGFVCPENDQDLWPLERAQFSDDRGRLIRGPFDPWPEIKKMQQSVVKKLSDAEEAEQRKREVQQAASASSNASGGISNLAARRKALEQRASTSSNADRPTSSKRESDNKGGGFGSSSNLKELQPVAPRSKRLSQILQQQEKQSLTKTTEGSSVLPIPPATSLSDTTLPLELSSLVQSPTSHSSAAEGDKIDDTSNSEENKKEISMNQEEAEIEGL